MAHLAPPPPPLLLTKRVTSFLSANLSPHLHTAALSTPSGRLLAHASTCASASDLRRQCAVAASLWAIHGGGGSPASSSSAYNPGYAHAAAAAADRFAPSSPYGDAVEAALPRTCSSPPAGIGQGSGTTPRAVTVQLEGGAVFVVRALRCGILFVAVGGSGGSERGASGSAASRNALPSLGASTTAAAASHGSNGASAAGLGGHGSSSTPPLGSPSEVESVLSTATGPGTASVGSQATSSAGGSSVAGSNAAAAVLATRKQAEELARWLDEKLGPLSVPDDRTGSGWDLR